MKREPILNTVKLIQEPLSITELFPNYRYEFQSVKVPEEAQQMYSKLLEFIKTNEELVLSSDTSEQFTQGFKRALAITRLWIDSIYVEDNQKNN